MEKNYHNPGALALEILRGKWLIEDDGTLRIAARAFLERQPVLSVNGDRNAMQMPYSVLLDGTVVENSLKKGEDKAATEHRVVVIPIIGTMTKYDNCFGCSTMEAADAISASLEDRSVAGFVLDIDSPGGSCASVMPLVSAIRNAIAAGKPVITHCDECASAAYWVASQTEGIFADNALSEVGSIGAYVQFWDNRENKQTGTRLVEVYAPQSTDKNASYRQARDGKVELMQEELARTVDQFISDVKAGRPFLDADAPGVLSGKMFPAKEAVANGMLNGMASVGECAQIVFMKTL